MAVRLAPPTDAKKAQARRASAFVVGAEVYTRHLNTPQTHQCPFLPLCRKTKSKRHHSLLPNHCLIPSTRLQTVCPSIVSPVTANQTTATGVLFCSCRCQLPRGGNSCP